MTAYERLDLLFEQNNGILKTAQVLENGITKSAFYTYAKQRGVEQAAHGVYVSSDAWTDAMYLLHLRCAQAVFSHESALFFHDLTDREPNPYSITVKTGYNPASLQADGIKVYTIKKELHDVGIVTMNTPFGNPISVYDMERTICDIVRSRSGIEMQTFQDALKQYTKRKDKDLQKLMRRCSVLTNCFGSIWRYFYDKDCKAVHERTSGVADGRRFPWNVLAFPTVTTTVHPM